MEGCGFFNLMSLWSSDIILGYLIWATKHHPSAIYYFTHPYTPLYIHTPLYTSIHPSIHPYTPLYIHTPFYTSIHPSIHPYTPLYIHTPLYTSIHPSIHPYTPLYTHAPHPLLKITFPYNHSPVHLSILYFIHSLTHPCRYFTPLPTHTSTHPSNHPLTHPFINYFTPVPTNLFIHPFISHSHPLIHSSIHPSLTSMQLLYLVSHSSIHPSNHPLTHPSVISHSYPLVH